MDELAEFCRRVRPQVVGCLVLYCGDRDLAEDLTQEALARTWLQRDRLDGIDRPEAWVFRVALNLANSHFRRRSAERRANRRATSSSGLTAERQPLADAASTIAIRDAVQALPRRQRAAIVARYYLDLDVAAAAEVLGCKPGTIKALTSQGVASLRRAGLVEAKESCHA